MKNYELISILSEYPAGYEVVFNSILDYEKSINGIDKECAQVEAQIKEVNEEQNTIFLS